MEKNPAQNRIGRRTIRVISLWIIAALLLALAPARAASDGMIRVLLTRVGTPSSLTFRVNCDYVLMRDDGYAIPNGSQVTLSASGGEMIVQCQGASLACGSSLRFCRTCAGVCGAYIQSPTSTNLLCGDLTFYASGSSISTVLTIYIEDYLCGVVGYEMSNSFPIEALKAQAVAARNYALRQKNARASSSYDVTDNTSSQVFKGYRSSDSNVIEAVRQTEGLVLYSGSSLASCYYTASNGGQTESTKNAWGGSLSYSVVKDDPYDLESTAAKTRTATIRKDATGLHDSLLSALKAGVCSALSAQGASTAAADILIRSIKSIEPKNARYASPSRLYQTLTFTVTASSPRTNGNGAALVTAEVDVPTYGGLESWYSLSLNSGKNETVYVEESKSQFTVTFRRWGHGIGMSQRGAQVMARDYGKSCSEILAFYYPGTAQKWVTLTDTSGGVTAGSSLLSTPEPTESPTPEPTESPTPEPSESPTPEPSESPASTLPIFTVSPTETTSENPAGEGDDAASAPSDTPAPTLPIFTDSPTEDSSEETSGEEDAASEPSDSSEQTLPDLAEPSEGNASDSTAGEGEDTGSDPSDTPAPILPDLAADTSDGTAGEGEDAGSDPSDTPGPTLPIFADSSTQQRVVDEPTQQSTPGPTPSLSPTPSPSPSPSPEATEVNTIMYVCVSEQSTLTLRDAPSTEGRALAALGRGTSVYARLLLNGWYYVTTQTGLNGYLSAKYLTTEVIATPAPTISAKAESRSTNPITDTDTFESGVTFCDAIAVTTTCVRVRAKNSTASECLGKLPKGTVVQVEAFNSVWAYISVNGRHGFVQHQYLKITG